MLWLYFTLLAVLLYSVGNVIDKYVLTEFFKRPMVSVTVSSFISFFVALAVALPQAQMPAPEILGLLLAAGFILFTANYLYFKAVFGEEVSRVIPVYSLQPIFIMFLAGAFLGEIILPWQYLGIFLIIGGSILISLRKKEKMEISQSFFLVLVSVVLYASADVILKHCLNFTSFWSAFFWQLTGVFMLAVIALAVSFKTVKQLLRQFPRAGGFAVFSEVLASFAHLSYVLAISLGLVTLVGGVMATLPAVTLVLATLTSFFKPHVIREELRRTTLLQKMAAIALVIAGTFLLL